MTEVDPIRAAATARADLTDEAAKRADIFVTATGNMDVITLDHMREMKDMAIVSNTATSTARSRSARWPT